MAQSPVVVTIEPVAMVKMTLEFSVTDAVAFKKDMADSTDAVVVAILAKLAEVGF